MWFNINHLSDASKSSGNKMGYFYHFVVSFKEFLFCLLMAFGSLIHAFFPWVLDFKLISWRVNRLKALKQKFPKDPVLEKVHFDE
jgi:hypothetical protein